MWSVEQVLFENVPVPTTFRNEREKSFFDFALKLRKCDFGACVTHPFIADVVSPVLKSSNKEYNSADELRAALTDSAEKYIDDADYKVEDDDVYRTVAVLATGVLFLRVFAQRAVSGPSFDYRTASEKVLDKNRGVVRAEHPLLALTILGHPDLPQDEIRTPLSQSIITALSCDGEVIYHRSPALAYLFCARTLFSLRPVLRGAVTGLIWNGRASFLHQRTLLGADNAPAASLIRVYVRDFAALLKQAGLLPADFHLGVEEDMSDFAQGASIVKTEDVWSIQAAELPPITRGLSEAASHPELKVELVLELAVRLAFLGRTRAFQEASRLANEAAEFHFVLTGAEGIRRRYQTRAFAQLVVKRFPTRAAKDAFEKGDDVVPSTLNEEGERTVDAPGYKQEREEAARKEERARLGLAEEETPESPFIEDIIDKVREAAGSGGVGVVSLDDADQTNDLIEGGVMLTGSAEERAGVEEALTVSEQVLLLAHCEALIKTMTNSGDELMVNQMSALVQRLLVKPPQDNEERKMHQKVVDGIVVVTEESARDDLGLPSESSKTAVTANNWLVFSAGLWFRCAAEHLRSKTQDRAALQLSVLADQYEDKSPGPGHRLRYLWCLNYPSLWELKREVAFRNLRVGAIMTALEQFKALHLWEEAGSCLIGAQRPNEAITLLEGIVNPPADQPEHEKITVTPGILCTLGDVKKDVTLYEKAWALSNQSYARAMRSIARLRFVNNDIPGALEAFEWAVKVNPLSFNAWFTKGNCEMRLGKMDAAFNSYSRCIALDDSDGDSWGNLVAVASQQGEWMKAHKLSAHACRRARENFRMWVSRISVCMRVNDVQGATEAVRQLALQGQLSQVDMRMLNWIAHHVTTDDPNECSLDGRHGTASARLVFNSLRFSAQRAGNGAPSLPPRPTPGSPEAARNPVRTFDVSMMDLWGALSEIAQSKGLRDIRGANEMKEKEGRLLFAHFEVNHSSLIVVKKQKEGGKEGEMETVIDRLPVLSIGIKLAINLALQAHLGYQVLLMDLHKLKNEEDYEGPTETQLKSRLASDLRTLRREAAAIMPKVRRALGVDAAAVVSAEAAKAATTAEEDERLAILDSKVQACLRVVDEIMPKVSLETVAEGDEDEEQ